MDDVPVLRLASGGPRGRWPQEAGGKRRLMALRPFSARTGAPGGHGSGPRVLSLLPSAAGRCPPSRRSGEARVGRARALAPEGSARWPPPDARIPPLAAAEGGAPRAQRRKAAPAAGASSCKNVKPAARPRTALPSCSPRPLASGRLYLLAAHAPLRGPGPWAPGRPSERQRPRTARLSRYPPRVLFLPSRRGATHARARALRPSPARLTRETRASCAFALPLDSLPVSGRSGGAGRAQGVPARRARCVALPRCARPSGVDTIHVRALRPSDGVAVHGPSLTLALSQRERGPRLRRQVDNIHVQGFRPRAAPRRERAARAPAPARAGAAGRRASPPWGSPRLAETRGPPG